MKIKYKIIAVLFIIIVMHCWLLSEDIKYERGKICYYMGWDRSDCSFLYYDEVIRNGEKIFEYSVDIQSLDITYQDSFRNLYYEIKINGESFERRFTIPKARELEEWLNAGKRYDEQIFSNELIDVYLLFENVKSATFEMYREIDLKVKIVIKY